MKKIFLISAMALSLQGCWAVFIPGIMIDAASDAITGAEGSSCVVAAAKVGDRVHIPSMKPATVKSLSGTSIRCKQPEYPIRALLAFDQ